MVQAAVPAISMRRPAPAVPVSKVTVAWVTRSFLLLSFLLALLEYEAHSAIAAYLHVAAFYLAGLTVLCGRNRSDRLAHVLSGGALLVTGVLFSEAVSYTSGDRYSTAYGLVFLGIILSARLIVQEIGINNVLRAFSQAGMLTALILAILGRHGIHGLTSAERFNGNTNVHPNLVGFVLGGFLPAIIWRALEYKVRWRQRVAIACALLTMLMIFRTGSRGTLGAVLAAGIVLLARQVTAPSWIKGIRLRHAYVIAALILVPLLLGYMTTHHTLGHVGKYLDDYLALTSSQRGIKSGLSGRTGIWHSTLSVLRAQNRWLFGFGYRAGDRFIGTIDNGYLQLLFDCGIIAGTLILGSMFRVFYLVWKASRRKENSAWKRFYIMITCMMIIYFLNNVSTRYLFSFGSAFSLCVLLLMSASRQELVGALLPAPAEKPKPAAARRPRPGLAWERVAR